MDQPFFPPGPSDIDSRVWLDAMSFANGGTRMHGPNHQHLVSTAVPPTATFSTVQPQAGPFLGSTMYTGPSLSAAAVPGQELTSSSPGNSISPAPATAKGRQVPGTFRGPFQCKWEGCRYTGSFHREADLLRHLRTLHISPAIHRCGIDNCGSVFNRKDNLRDHTRRYHSHCQPCRHC
ncbi:hypothetical protein ASPBRDRAFT_650104 [Aspergillus brasiliensis CBS 101740]|uniref:C2H2-type domain-containing protein n=1 Tax=Aspergillus brasiliensis (strain CBS 101740 / IMI 381727 / IBT 21946) TaxID=767769 RepID=A0A1L9UEI0_ASPBC|nr:hypothetical protein ASPBRDRAFT_650104 [Aspergillus brasiliensis CBS 101740]